MLLDYQKEFIQYSLQCGVLNFGQFWLKSGRLSPYFFNTGLFNTGERLGKLGYFYAKALETSGLDFDMLFGPAYKGIPLVTSMAVAYAGLKQDVPFAFNRKEVKDHGEGGVIVGAELTGKVLIVDDVITAGTSIRESVDIIRQAGAEVAGVLISLNRQEQGIGAKSAIQEIEEVYGIKVSSIIALTDIMEFLKFEGNHEVLRIIEDYHRQYGV